MPIATGTRLGPYEIVGPLGAGGMGEVYRARDTRLDRDVAVKVLAQHLSAYPEVRARFEREAKTISSLNHPRICTLFDVGREGDINYLVMELVEGESLAQRLEKGALPGPAVLEIGAQIADALDKAHRAGIVHRDLKPGNVMLTKAGAKLMDFGLARATGVVDASEASVAGPPQSQTIDKPLTAEGTIIGTFQYMAPEQLEGREADTRSDLWALGCVLYEMATGRRAFEGKSKASLIGAIMHAAAPSISALAPMTPPGLERLVQACLAKDPADRLQSAHDVRMQLQWLAEAGSEAGVPAPVAARRKGRAKLVTALAAAGWLAAVAIAVTAARPRDDRATLALGALTPVSIEEGLETDPVISPDGTLVAYTAGRGRRMRIFIRAVAGGRARPLTDDPDPFEFQPRWSPDGNEILYITRTQVLRAPKLGGAARIVATNNRGFTGAAWSPDGKQIAVCRGKKLAVAQADGSGERELAEAPDWVWACAWGPNGRIACAYGTLNLTPRAFGNLAPSGILTVAAAGGDTVPLVAPENVNYSPAWSADGRELYFVSNRNGAMDVYAVRVAADGHAEGEPLRVTAGLGAWWIHFTADGRRLAYATLALHGNFWSMPIPVRETDTAEITPVTSGRQLVEFLRISPDQRSLVYDSTVRTSSDLFRIPVSGGEPTEVVSTPADEFAPDLSPNGREIAYHAFVDGSREVFVKPVEGGAARQLTTAASAQESLPVWTPDGEGLVYLDQGWKGGLFLMRRDPSGVWGAPEFLGRSGSPVGAWLRDGRAVYVRDGRIECLSMDTRQIEVVYAPSGAPDEPLAEKVASEDGQTLYFTTHGADGRASIWRFEPAGGRPTCLVRFLDRHSSVHPNFAVGAGRFYFRIEDYQADVWVADITRPTTIGR